MSQKRVTIAITVPAHEAVREEAFKTRKTIMEVSSDSILRYLGFGKLSKRKKP